MKALLSLFRKRPAAPPPLSSEERMRGRLIESGFLFRDDEEQSRQGMINRGHCPCDYCNNFDLLVRSRMDVVKASRETGRLLYDNKRLKNELARANRELVGLRKEFRSRNRGGDTPR